MGPFALTVRLGLHQGPLLIIGVEPATTCWRRFFASKLFDWPATLASIESQPFLIGSPRQRESSINQGLI